MSLHCCHQREAYHKFHNPAANLTAYPNLGISLERDFFCRTSGPVITSEELPISLPQLLEKSIISRIHPYAQESIIVHVSIVEARAIASLDS